MTPSTSRNKAGRPLRMRPAHRRVLEVRMIAVSIGDVSVAIEIAFAVIVCVLLTNVGLQVRAKLIGIRKKCAGAKRTESLGEKQRETEMGEEALGVKEGIGSGNSLPG